MLFVPERLAARLGFLERALGWLPLVELRNPGDEPVRILAVRRRGALTTRSYLHVTRPEA